MARRSHVSVARGRSAGSARRGRRSPSSRASVVWTVAPGKESTDDAQVDGHITQIATRVGGTVVEVAVSDNQHVEAGTVLVGVDPRDYQVAVDRAAAELADARGDALAAGAGVPIAAVVDASDVRTARGRRRGGARRHRSRRPPGRGGEGAARRGAGARARARRRPPTKAERDVERLQAARGEGRDPAAAVRRRASRRPTRRARRPTRRSRRRDGRRRAPCRRASSARCRPVAADRRAGRPADARTAPEQMQATRARAAAADARVKQTRSGRSRRRSSTSNAPTIKAPIAGIVSRKIVELGQVVQAGQPLMALVSRDDVWVVANFKETQLADMRAGQPATIEVDALGGTRFTGKVDSIGAATGARFSLLPPENATGNFVKVVQRVPVKIVLEPGQDPEHGCGPACRSRRRVYTK